MTHDGFCTKHQLLRSAPDHCFLKSHKTLQTGY